MLNIHESDVTSWAAPPCGCVLLVYASCFGVTLFGKGLGLYESIEAVATDATDRWLESIESTGEV